MATQSIFSTSSLRDLCLIKLIEELEYYSPEQLNRLPPVYRKQLLFFCPVVSICRLEKTCAFDGIDSEVFWDELFEIHKELFVHHYDAEAVYAVLRASYSSNRDKYFVFLTTIICSGGRFSGHFKVSNVEIVTRREHLVDMHRHTLPADVQYPTDIINYLVAYCKPNAVNEEKVATRAAEFRVEDDSEIMESNDYSKDDSDNDSRNESYDSSKDSFYYPLPAQDALGLKPGEVYEGATKGQYVHSHFSHFVSHENHYRLSDEDAIALIMSECHFYPRSLLLHDYDSMQWTWSRDALLALLTQFFSKLESLSVRFRQLTDVDIDYAMVGRRERCEDLETVLTSCFRSPLLKSVEIFGVYEESFGPVLASTLASKPCPSINSLKISHGKGDAKSSFEALATIIASHDNLSELTLDLGTELTSTATSFSHLNASLINFIQNKEYFKLTIGGIFPSDSQLRSLLDVFLKMPCSHSQQLCLEGVQQSHNEEVSTNINLPVNESPIDKAPSGALEYKSLFVDKRSMFTVDFCEWLFSHQPLVVKAFHFNALLATGKPLPYRSYDLISSGQAAPIHLLFDNALFRTQDLSLPLVSGLPNEGLQSVLHHKSLRKLSLTQQVRHFCDYLCDIGDIADILSLKLETLTDLTIIMPVISLGSSTHVERFGDAVFSLPNCEEFSLSVSVYWRNEDSKYIEVLYKKWLKHGCKKMKLFHMGVLSRGISLTDEISRMKDEMELKTSDHHYYEV